MPVRIKNGLPLWLNPGVYAITCNTNGKVYVGSALSVRGRLHAHRSSLRRGVHDNQHLQRAWDKYGERSFRFNLLEPCRAEDVVMKEQYWIDSLGATDRAKGFNICLFAYAGGMKGRKHTEESRRKVSESKKGKANWQAGVTAAAETCRGRKRSDNERAAISAKLKGRVFSKEHRANISATHWTKGPKAAEAIEKMRAKLAGRKQSEETLAKKAAAVLRRHMREVSPN